MNKKEILITLGVVVLALATILVGYELGWSPLAGEDLPILSSVTDYEATLSNISVDGTTSYGARFDASGATEGWYTVKVAAGQAGGCGENNYKTERVYIGSADSCQQGAEISSTCSCGGNVVDSGYCCYGGALVDAPDDCPTSSVSVYVFNQLDELKENIALTFTGNHGAVITLVSDREGFDSGEFPPGTYDISCPEAVGYTCPAQSIQVQDDGESLDYYIEEDVALNLENKNFYKEISLNILDWLTRRTKIKNVLAQTNNPPVLSPIGEQSVRLGETLEISLEYSDPDEGDVVSCTAAGTPLASGAIFNAEECLFSWTPEEIATGEYTVNFSVSDSSSGVDSEEVIIGVMEAEEDCLAVGDEDGDGYDTCDDSDCFSHAGCFNYDSTEDGASDCIGFDSNEDGEFDCCGFYADQDNTFTCCGEDTDGDGVVDSCVEEGGITAVSPVVFEPETGTYGSAQSVTLSSETSGATIYYTTNGATPTIDSTLYEGAIEITESTTIKAIATKAGMGDSEITTAIYTIEVEEPPIIECVSSSACEGRCGYEVTEANYQVSLSYISTDEFTCNGGQGVSLYYFDGEASVSATLDSGMEAFLPSSFGESDVNYYAYCIENLAGTSYSTVVASEDAFGEGGINSCSDINSYVEGSCVASYEVLRNNGDNTYTTMNQVVFLEPVYAQYNVIAQDAIVAYSNDGGETCYSSAECLEGDACNYTGVLTGVVASPGGNTLPTNNLNVYVSGGSGWNTYLTSNFNVDGAFVIEDIPFGQHYVLAGMAGCDVDGNYYGMSDMSSVTIDSTNNEIGETLELKEDMVNSLEISYTDSQELRVSGTANMLPGEKVYITIEKEEENSTLNLQVISSSIDQVISGASVRLVEEGGGEPIEVAETDDEGRATLNNFAEGYGLEISREGFENFSVANLTTEDIEGGYQVDLELTGVSLSDGRGDLSDSSYRVTGGGVERQWIRLVAEDGEGNNLISGGKYELVVRSMNEEGDTLEKTASIMRVVDPEVSLLKNIKLKIGKLLTKVSNKLARNIGINKAIASSRFDNLDSELTISLVDAETGEYLTGEIAFASTVMANFAMPVFEACDLFFSRGQNLTIIAHVPGYVSQTINHQVDAAEETLLIEMNSKDEELDQFLSVSPNYNFYPGGSRIVEIQSTYYPEGTTYLTLQNLKPKISLKNAVPRYIKSTDDLNLKLDAEASEGIESLKFKLANGDADDAERVLKKTQVLDEIVNEVSNAEINVKDIFAEEADGIKRVYVDVNTSGGAGVEPEDQPYVEVVVDNKPPKLKEGKTKPFKIAKDGLTYEEDDIDTLRITQGEVVDLYANLKDDTSVTSDVSGLSSITYNVDGVEVCSYSTADGYEDVAEIACEWDTANLHSEVQVIGEDGAGNTYISDPYTVAVDTTGDSRRRVDTTPPAEVTDVSVTNVGDGESLDIGWNNPDDSDLAGVKIYRSLLDYANEEDLELITNIDDVEVTSYRDTDLITNTTYYYILRSYDNSDNIQPSTTQYSGTPEIAEEEIAPDAEVDSDDDSAKGSSFEPVEMEFELSRPTGGAKARFQLLRDAQNVSVSAITTEKPEDIPEIINPTQRVYRYFSVDANVTEDDVDEIIIDFSVDKGWMSENQISVQNIKFYHFVYHSPGVWEEIEATQIDEDDDYYYFSGWTSQLGGLYAIAGRPGYVSTSEILTGSIAGKLFIDTNRNAKVDEDEIGAEDLVIELYIDNGDKDLNLDNDELLLAQQVGIDGKYNFDELPEGNYILYISRDSLPENYKLSTESDVVFTPLYENENLENIDIGYEIIADSDIESLAEIKEKRTQEGIEEVIVTKKLRRNVEPQPIVRRVVTEAKEKVDITPAIVWAIVIVLVLVILVWQLTKGTDCCKLKK